MGMRSSPLGGGDLGRRIIGQCRRTGLSRPEAAERAGIAAGCLRYLETSAAPGPAPGDLGRLASALDTAPAALLGVGLASPPGQSRSQNAQPPEPLGADECRDFLADGGIGRFVCVTERGPVAVPVNFRMAGPDVVFRTPASAGPAAASAGGPGEPSASRDSRTARG